MSLRPPRETSQSGRPRTGLAALDHELAEEMAIALGRAGSRVAETLAVYEAGKADADARPVLLGEAARAVHAYFIQRELCGLRRHDDAIRHYAIPPEVLARLGAS